MTVQEFLNSALNLSGALGPGRGANSSQLTVALEAVNAMLGQWSTQRLAVYVITSAEYTLTPGTATYTIGSGGDFDTARPNRIERANLVVGDQRYPLELISDQKWSAISLPDLTSTLPTHLYEQRTYPLTTLRLWPAPTAGNKLELFTWQALSRFASLDATIEWPDGYEEAVKYNLAVRLKTAFPRALSQSHPAQASLVLQLAREALANIKRLNKLTPELTPDPIMGVPRLSGSPFDWRKGE